jgi:hypothetical protein
MPIVFHERSGKPHARMMQQVIKLGDRGLQCDVAVGLLNEPLPDSIRRYPLPAMREDEGLALIGATALVTDQKRRLYFHRVADVQAGWLRMRFDDNFSKARRKSLAKGDSGHPTFILSEGELVLVATHTISGPGTGPYYGSRAIQDKLREVVRELDPEFKFRTLVLDLPTLADAEAGRQSVPPPPRPVIQPAAVSIPQCTPATRSATSPQEPRRPLPRVLPPRPSM